MTPESELKKALKAHLKAHDPPVMVIPIPGGAYGMNGAPDLVACYRGRFIAIEGKTHEGVLSEWQRMRCRQIEDAGGIYTVVRDVSDIDPVLESIDNLKS